MNPPTRARRGLRRLEGSFALTALLAVLLPLLWLRVGTENTLWIDEIHSLQLSQLGIERLIDESVQDFHPPGYPLALKLWLKAGRGLGLDPGLPWARALNVLAWLAVVASAWCVGREVLGRREGALVAACVAASAAASVVVHDVRSYAFASGGLLVGTLFLVALRGPKRSRTRDTLLATGCAAALTIALWSHLLAAPAVALLTATWLALVVVTPGERRSWRLRTTLLAQLAPWLLFLPWLLEIPDQVVHLRRISPDWMTPASWDNLVRVFTWWLPLGRIGAPSPVAELWLTALGGLAILVPLALGARALQSATPQPSAAASLALLTLSAAGGSTLLFWGLARLDLAATFHGPRYPLLVWGLLAVGLTASAIAGSRRFAHAVAAMSFWLLAGILGQVLAIRQESPAGGLSVFASQIADLAPTGSSLYVMPSELAPFVRRTFAAFDLRKIEDLVCSPPDNALVLDVNPWPALDRTRDQVIGHSIRAGLLAAGIERRDSNVYTAATAYRIDGIDRRLAQELCARGMRPLPAAPPVAVSSAAPEDQLAGDGWSYLELDEQLDARRWGTRPEVRVRFDQSVPPGDYLLHLIGARQPYPSERIDLAVEMKGTSLHEELSLGPGPFSLVLPVIVERSHRPVLRVRHPTWSPAVAMGSSDERELSFLFDAAWLSAPR